MTDVEDEIVENLLEYVGCNNIDIEIDEDAIRECLYNEIID